jgi:hypothetical protein
VHPAPTCSPPIVALVRFGSIVTPEGVDGEGGAPAHHTPPCTTCVRVGGWVQPPLRGSLYNPHPHPHPPTSPCLSLGAFNTLTSPYCTPIMREHDVKLTRLVLVHLICPATLCPASPFSTLPHTAHYLLRHTTKTLRLPTPHRSPLPDRGEQRKRSKFSSCGCCDRTTRAEAKEEASHPQCGGRRGDQDHGLPG